MSYGTTGGKRQREAIREKKKKEKLERLSRNRAMRAQGYDPDIVDPSQEALPLPEVKLEDIIVSGVAPRGPKGSYGPRKLFVGGLSWETSNQDLKTAFEKFGAVTEASVVMDRNTGRSRGFGFVTFENALDAASASKQMNGADLDGRSLRVNPAEG